MSTALRPMSLAELLDRTFYLYRKHFTLFVGIVAVPYLVLLAFQLGQVVIPKYKVGIWSVPVLLLATMLVYLGALAASQAATVIAVSQVHLDRPTSISQVFSAVRGKVLRAALIMMGVGLGVGIGLILLVVPGIILALMWSLAIPVAILEDAALGEATSRSSQLTKGHRGRIFVIFVLFLILTYMAIVAFAVPLTIVAGVLATKGVGTPEWVALAFPILTFFAQILTSPLYTIAISLVYYDERVRKEAFDLQLMMSELDGVPTGAAAASSI